MKSMKLRIELENPEGLRYERSYYIDQEYLRENPLELEAHLRAMSESVISEFVRDKEIEKEFRWYEGFSEYLRRTGQARNL